MGGCDRCIRMNLLCTRRRFNYDDHPTSNLCGEEASYLERDAQPPSNLCGEAPSLSGQWEDVQPPSNLCGEAPLTLDSGEVDQPTSNTSGEATSDATPDSKTVLLQETPSSGYDSESLQSVHLSLEDINSLSTPQDDFSDVHHHVQYVRVLDGMQECRTYPVTTMQNHCLGCTVAFRANSDPSWRFGVIDKIQYRLDVGNNSPVDCHVALWQWNIPEGYNPNSCARKGIPLSSYHKTGQPLPSTSSSVNSAYLKITSKWFG
jgi:hypothetical protein